MTITVDSSGNEERLVPCGDCRQPTHHVVLTSAVDAITIVFEDNPEALSYRSSYEVVQCLGCKTVSFRSEVKEARGKGDGDEEIVKELVRVYPPRLPNGRKSLYVPEDHLPRKVRTIYDETIIAVSNEAYVVAAIGIRAIVEAVCQNRGETKGSLESKIDNLVKNGVLTVEGGKILHLTRFLGNEAAHEIERPSLVVLEAALDVVEHLIQTVYLLPKTAEILQRT